MKGTDDIYDKQLVSKRVTRSRLHYKPKSLLEILLTTVLSIFLGSGMLFITTIDAQQKNIGRQAQADTIEQCVNLQSNLSSDPQCGN